MTKVWRDAHGKLFHDACFEEGESRDGYTLLHEEDPVGDDEECESCGGSLEIAADDDAVDEDDDDSDDDDD